MKTINITGANYVLNKMECCKENGDEFIIRPEDMIIYLHNKSTG